MATIKVEGESSTSDTALQGDHGEWTVLDAFCRICLLRREDLQPLVSQVDTVMIPEMLYKVCGVRLEIQERYPRRICLQCVTKLHYAYTFWNEFRKQEELLRNFSWKGPLVEQLVAYQAEQEQEQELETDRMMQKHPDIFGKAAVVQKGSADQDEAVDEADESDAEGEYLETIECEQVKEEMIYAELSEGEEKEAGNSREVIQMSIVRLESNNGADSEAPELEDSEDYDSRGNASEGEESLSYYGENGKDANATDRDDPDYTCDQQPESFRSTRPSRARKKAEVDEYDIVIDPLRCYICDLQAATEDDLDSHLETHVEMLPFECKMCDTELGKEGVRKIATLSILHAHFRSHEYKHKCQVCFERFPRKIQLTNHHRIHSNVFHEYKCAECDRRFTVRKTWQNHMQRHKRVEEEAYKCNLCGKLFGTNPRLLRHYRSHTGERPFKCKYCEKGFYDKNQLLRHRALHINEKGFQCEYCGECFHNNNRLDTHRAKHLSGKDLVEYLANRRKGYKVAQLKDNRCPFNGCDYTATTYGAMYVHKRTKHLATHTCGFCGKRFPFANQLRTHEKIHTGEKPYECADCGKTFRRQFSYNEHLAVHKSNQTYECEVCGKGFTRPRYLHAHILTHTCERRYACDLCDSKYKTKGELTKHRKVKHSIHSDAGIQVDEIDEIGEFFVEYV